MDYPYSCEQCGHEAALCVSDWAYVAALCDDCLKERKTYLKLPEPQTETRSRTSPLASAPAG